MIQLSDEEEVTQGVGSELQVISLCGVFLFCVTHGISNTKEHMKRGFLPAWERGVSNKTEIGNKD